MDKELLSIREKVWVEAWCRVAQSDTCGESITATIWADKCLKAFDERFPKNRGEDEQ